MATKTKTTVEPVTRFFQVIGCIALAIVAIVGVGQFGKMWFSGQTGNYNAGVVYAPPSKTIMETVSVGLGEWTYPDIMGDRHTSWDAQEQDLALDIEIDGVPYQELAHDDPNRQEVVVTNNIQNIRFRVLEGHGAESGHVKIVHTKY